MITLPLWLAGESLSYQRGRVNIGLDAEAAYQYLVKTRGLDPSSIVSLGQSLGTAVAVDLAAHHGIGGVIPEAPFPSASRVARKISWFLPGLSLLLHSQFDTQSKRKQISAPILIVHCNQDPVLPFQFGAEVYDSARTSKYFLQIDGYCHEEASVIAPAQYRPRYKTSSRPSLTLGEMCKAVRESEPYSRVLALPVTAAFFVSFPAILHAG